MLRRSFLTARWHYALVVLFVVVIVYRALKVGGAMKPGTRANEDAASKPLGAIVAVGGTAVGSGLIVAVGTFGGYADFNADLGLCFGSVCCEAETADSG